MICRFDLRIFSLSPHDKGSSTMPKSSQLALPKYFLKLDCRNPFNALLFSILDRLMKIFNYLNIVVAMAALN